MSRFSAQLVASGAAVFVVWTENASIQFNRSLDGGATWLPTPLRLDTPTASPQALSPAIAMSGDAVYVAWIDRRHDPQASGNVYLNRSLDRGLTWLGRDVRINTDHPIEARSKAVRLATGGTAVYAAWADGRAGTQLFEQDVHFTRSLDRGETWLAADVRLNTDPAGQGNIGAVDIAADGETVIVGWEDGREGFANTDIYWTRSANQGTTWLAADVRVNTQLPGVGAYRPRLAYADGVAHAIWIDNRNGRMDVFVRRSFDGGATWPQPEVRVDTNPPGTAVSVEPRIAAAGTSVYTTWLDSRNGPSDIYSTHWQTIQPEPIARYERERAAESSVERRPGRSARMHRAIVDGQALGGRRVTAGDDGALLGRARQRSQTPHAGGLLSPNATSVHEVARSRIASSASASSPAAGKRRDESRLRPLRAECVLSARTKLRVPRSPSSCCWSRTGWPAAETPLVVRPGASAAVGLAPRDRLRGARRSEGRREGSTQCRRWAATCALLRTRARRTRSATRSAPRRSRRDARS